MEITSFLVFQHGEQASLCKLDKFHCLYDLIYYVIRKWNELSKFKIKFEYTFGPNSHMLLDSDEDFQSLCVLVKKKSIEYVEVTIKRQSVETDVGECSNVCMSQSSKATGVLCSDVIMNDVDHVSSVCNDVPMRDPLSTFCERRLKMFLSDNWGKLIKGVGDYFEEGMAEYRLILAKYCIANGIRYRLSKNSPVNVIAVCQLDQSTQCPWRISAIKSRRDGFIHIKSFVRTHTCGNVFISTRDINVSSELVSSLMLDVVRATPQSTPTSIRSELKLHYGLDVTYKVARQALFKARKQVFGDEGLSFDALRFYFERTKSVDPSSTLRLEYDINLGNFQRCFISFGAAFHGFQHCRPMIFLDGTHLIGKYKGVLLAATTKDGNMGLFNIAFAVVGHEDYENWNWFLHQLKPLVGAREINFISDREKGIIKAVEEQFPYDHHSYCYVHLIRNLKSKFKGAKETRDKVVEYFTKMAYASSKEDYEEAYNKASFKGGKKFQQFMSYLHPNDFSKFYVEGVRYGEMTSNASESFNSQIQRYKHLPVTEMIDGIRRRMMEQMCRRKLVSQKWTSILCPDMLRRNNALVEEGRAWMVYQSSEKVFEVMAKICQTVDIEERTCTCCTWQHDGFPCAHAVAVFQTLTLAHPFELIDKHFYSETYRNVYEDNIRPVHGFDPGRVADEIVILPPTTDRRLPGRPKTQRIPSVGEVPKNKMRCSRCGIMGRHNKRTCRAPI